MYPTPDNAESGRKNVCQEEMKVARRQWARIGADVAEQIVPRE